MNSKPLGRMEIDMKKCINVLLMMLMLADLVGCGKNCESKENTNTLANCEGIFYIQLKYYSSLLSNVFFCNNDSLRFIAVIIINARYITIIITL